MTLWPWSEIARLKGQIARLEERDVHRLFVSELRETMALKAMRELAGANKGIRRLKAKLDKVAREEHS